MKNQFHSAGYVSIWFIVCMIACLSVGCSSDHKDDTNKDTTPPMILSVSPERSATDVSPSSAITITFSENMDTETLDDESFLVMAGETAIQGTVSLNDATAMFRPDTAFESNTTYQVTVKNTVCDVAGNPIQEDYLFSFTTGATNDAVAPQILSTTPACGATDVSPNTAMTVTFSEPMDPASLQIIPFTINDGTQDIGGTVTYSGVTAAFHPDQDLQHNTTYTASISTNPTDLSGNHLANALTCSFTTGSALDTTPPAIIATTPSCGATNVSPNTAMTVTFSEPMDPDSLHVIPFSISDGQTEIGGTITFSGVTASFKPDQDLAYNTTYTASISTNPTDLSGNHLENTLTCSFTTGSAPDTTPPRIIATTPACGATDVAPNTAMSVTFSEAMNPNSLHVIPFAISDGETEIGGTITYSGVTAAFKPDQDLEYDTTYTASISTNPTDLSGNHLENTLSCSFTTGSAPDTTPPQIVTIVPACGATDVSLNTPMSVTFSEAMDPDSLHVIPFVLSDGETEIGGTVNYSGVTATFTPNASLEYNKTYTGSISTNPTDLAGNHLEESLTCSFSTPASSETPESPDDSSDPPTVTLTADTTAIRSGESLTLSWSSTLADSCSISPGIGAVALSGTTDVSPTQTTTYTITATGEDGTTQADLTITVTSPPTVTLTASPASLVQGTSTSLSWTSENATACAIDNDIGSVNVTGTTVVTPASTTIYTITASGPEGNASAQVLVEVSVDIDPQTVRSFGADYEDLIPANASKTSYDSERFAVITGLVNDISGQPVAGVWVSVYGFPEYGIATTNADGRFSIPVEGGMTFTVVYQKQGLISAQRTVYVPWNDIAIVETLQMVAEDTLNTTFTFDGSAATVAAHQSTTVTDDFGSRACTMVFTGDNQAFEVDADGNTVKELTTITVRATEYATPESMPALLPPTTAYTFCAELSVDGIQRVRFQNPVIVWVDNFIGFDVGDVAPVGYYDMDQAEWVATQNGLVVELLDGNGDGVVDALDSDGDGLPNDLDGDGVFDDEVVGLTDSTRYQAGATYWRVEIDHLTAYDINWPYQPNDTTAPDADKPKLDDVLDDKDDDDDCINSYVEVRSRVFHEDIPILGTDMTLHYASSRVNSDQHVFRIPVTGDTVPASLKSVLLEIEIAGQKYSEVYDPTPNQTRTFRWDGKDVYGRDVRRTVSLYTKIGYVYDMVYAKSNNSSSNAFGKREHFLELTMDKSRMDFTVWSRNQLWFSVYPADISTGFGNGWSLSAHHQIDRGSSYQKALYKGNGSKNTNVLSILETIAGTGEEGYSGDGGPAEEAQFGYASSMAIDAEGNIYIADRNNHRVRKVDPDGIITTIAGNGENVEPEPSKRKVKQDLKLAEQIVFDGDGGPATDALLNTPEGIALDAKGNLYIADSDDGCIRKVDPNGIITTVAEDIGGGVNGVAVDSFGGIFVLDSSFYNGTVRKIDNSGEIYVVAGNNGRGFSGDGGDAALAQLNSPEAIAVDRDGNLYIADTYNNRIRKVDPRGIITTIAGGGSPATLGDGGPAVEAKLSYPCGIFIDDQKNIYIADSANCRIRKINSQGIITTIAGGPDYTDEVENGKPATQTYLSPPQDVALYGNGVLCVLQSDLLREVTTSADFLREDDTWITFTEENGQGYDLDVYGRHTRTVDLDTGVTLRRFSYNAAGRLVGITDQFGNQTTIERGADGLATAIVSPDGLRTELTLDGNQLLTHITYPDDSFYEFQYQSDDIMTLKIDPAGNRFTYLVDAGGRLTYVNDEEGGSWVYQRETTADNDILTTVTSAEANVTTYLDRRESSGATTAITTGPNGGQTTLTKSADALTEQKTLACGMTYDYAYGAEPQYLYKYLNTLTITTPLGLEKVFAFDRAYTDADEDDMPELITKTIKVNEKATVYSNNVTTSIKTVTSPAGRVATTLYDPATLLPLQTSVHGLNATSFVHDSKGRMTSKTTGTRTTAYSYDFQGNLESVTDPENHTTTYGYDALGRVTSANRPDSTSLSFTYDKNGQLTALTTPANVTHVFSYNKVKKNTAYQAPLSGNYLYEYDKDRRLIRKTFPSGAQINYLFDQARLSQLQTPEGDIDFTYHCGQKIASVTNGTESVGYEYDGSLVTQETLSGVITQTITYSYNNDFNLSAMTYAGTTENYAYDDDALLITAGSYTITRNAQNGLPESFSGGVLNIGRTYSAYGEQATRSYTVNSLNVAAWSVNRNDNGRVISKTETINGTATTYDYTYDSMGRLLTVAQDSVIVETYQYNSNGSRSHETNSLRGVDQDLSYSDEDHLLTAGSVAYQHNTDGFLAVKTAGTDVTSYDYSVRGELNSVALPSGDSITYAHDALGRRIVKYVNGSATEKYLWQGISKLLAVYDGSNTLDARFEYAGARLPVAMTRSGSRYYLSYDQIGSLRIVTDSSGNIVKRIDYDTFGNIVADSDPSFAVPFGFAGGLHDRHTGLVRFGHRDYDPQTGRWTAKDPLLFAGGDTDLYGYCLNDPVNLVDPFGLKCEEEIDWDEILELTPDEYPEDLLNDLTSEEIENLWSWVNPDPDAEVATFENLNPDAVYDNIPSMSAEDSFSFMANNNADDAGKVNVH